MERAIKRDAAPSRNRTPALPTFEVRDLAVPGVEPVSFSLEPGGAASLAGPSGVGKTRLLRAMADLEPHDGEVRLDGTPSGAVAPREWRRRVALVPAESAWWERTVAEHFPAWPPTHMEALALAPAMGERSVEHLSSGERQRLALLRALAAEPGVLLLDEVTANLDRENAQRVDAVVERLRERGVAVVRVGHDSGPGPGTRIEVRPA